MKNHRTTRSRWTNAVAGTRPLLALIPLIALGPAGAAHAGNREGHGGRVWECALPDGSKAYELFEYRLARETWGLEIGLGEGDEHQKVRRALERLRRVEPGRAERYLARAAEFMSRSELVEEEFINLGDVNRIFVKPANCEPRLVVNQRTWADQFRPENRDQPKFKITRRLWEALDATQRAGIILHEVTYEDAASQGHEDADQAMYLTALISSSRMERIPAAEWVEALKLHGFGFIQSGILLDPATLQKKKDGGLAGVVKDSVDPTYNRVRTGAARDQFVTLTGRTKRWRLRQGFSDTGPKSWEEYLSQEEITAFFPDGRVESGFLRGSQSFRAEGVSLRLAGRVRFHPNGMIRLAELLNPQGVPLPETQVAGQTVSLGDCRSTDAEPEPYSPEDDLRTCVVGFHPSGEFRILPIRGAVELRFLGKRLSLRDRLSISPDDDLVAGIVARRIELRTATGRERKFSEMEAIFFTPAGAVANRGIFSTYDFESYIDIVPVGAPAGRDRLAFAWCSLHSSGRSPEPCEPIGSWNGFRRRDLYRNLGLSAREYLRFRAPGRQDSADIRAELAILGSSLLMFPAGEVGSRIRASGDHGRALMLAPLAASLLVFKHFRDYENSTSHRRAVNRILDYGYLLTHLPLERIRYELERSLERIGERERN